MIKQIKIVFSSLLIIAVLAGCKETVVPKQEKKSTTSKPVMEMNGRVIYEADFFDFAGTVLKEMDPVSFSNPAIKENLLKDFVEHNMLLNEARRRGVTIDDQRIKDVLASFKTEEGAQDLKVYSGSYDTDHTKLAKLLQERLLVESFLNNVVNSQIVINDGELRDYFKQNYASEKPEVKAHILHIFTTDEARAEKAMKELKKGLSFNEVAERYSEGPEKEFGGDLGFISDKDFPEIFEEAFKLPIGKFGNIVKSDYGYHIFLVKKIDRPKKVIYDDIKSKIYFEIYTLQQEEKTREFINELYKVTNIKYLDDIDLNNFTSKGRSNQ